MINEMPFSSDAEQAVLGCMFLDENSAKVGYSLLNSDDFFQQNNKIVFEAFSAVLKSGKIADVVTVSECLKQQNNFEKIGGKEYIVQIAMSVATSVRMKEYIKILKEKAYFRRKIAQGRALTEAGFQQDKQKLQQISKQSEQDGVQTEKIACIPDVLADYITLLQKDRNSNKRFAGLPTGFDDLDYYIGGLQQGNLIIVAGRPAMGKTAFALDLLRNGAKNMGKEYIAMLFSLEMDKNRIAARMFSAESSVDNAYFRLCVKDDEKWQKIICRIQQEAKEFEQNTSDIYVDDTAGITLEEIYEKCHNQQVQTGKKIGLVVVDYLQIMGVEKTANRAMDIAYLSMGLKNLSKQFSCPVVALSQLSRENEKKLNKKPTLDNLRDSGAIEQDADIVLMLYREKYYDKDTPMGNIAEVIIAKNRNGATGSVELEFLENYTTFRNCIL